MQHLQANIMFLGQLFRNCFLLCASPSKGSPGGASHVFPGAQTLGHGKQPITCILHEAAMPGWAQASELDLSVSHLGGTAQPLLQVKWQPLHYKASYRCKVSTGNLHHYWRTCADGQRLSTRKAEGKSSGEPQITMDGSKPVREIWGQWKGTESSSGEETRRSREKITERRARGKKRAMTEQNKSEEAWKRRKGRKMNTLGRDGPSSKKKPTNKTVRLNRVSDFTAQSDRAGPGTTHRCDTVTWEGHLSPCSDDKSDKTVAEKDCQKPPCHCKGKTNPSFERLLTHSSSTLVQHFRGRSCPHWS